VTHTTLTRDEILDALLTAIRLIKVGQRLATHATHSCVSRLQASVYLARAAWLILNGHSYGPGSEFCQLLTEAMQLLYVKADSKPPGFHIAEELYLTLCIPQSPVDLEIARQLAATGSVELSLGDIEA